MTGYNMLHVARNVPNLSYPTINPCIEDSISNKTIAEVIEELKVP
jgi:hypothetical protein